MLRECLVRYAAYNFAVKAESLYKAAGWGLAYFVSHGMLPISELSSAILSVQVGEKSYRVRAQRVQEWLRDWSGSTREVMVKSMTYREMGRRD